MSAMRGSVAGTPTYFKSQKADEHAVLRRVVARTTASQRAIIRQSFAKAMLMPAPSAAAKPTKNVGQL
jgi:hypothetical protein